MAPSIDSRLTRLENTQGQTRYRLYVGDGVTWFDEDGNEVQLTPAELAEMTNISADGEPDEH